jgi:hypothetical protein
MPNWQPNRNPVRWDHGAADQAVRALYRAADELDHVLAERQRAAGVATADWRGRYRLEFDTHLSSAIQRSRALADEYRAAARSISTAGQRASDEQRRRNDEVRRWEDERRDEERREREERERREREAREKKKR